MADYALSASECGLSRHKKGTSVISPINYEGFHDRLKSFLITAWHRMPLQLSPLACSKNGWRFESCEAIVCDFCNKSLNLILPKRNYDLFQKKTKELEEKLVTEHRTGCIWKSGLHLPEYFLTKEMASQERLEDSLLANSIKISEHLDSFSTVRFFVSSECVEQSRADLSLYADSNTLHLTALTVAVHGWRVRTVDKERYLHCTLCCRKLPLWNKEIEEGFDLRRHLIWCPWIQSLSPASLPIVNRMCQHVSQQLSKKRKRESLEYTTSHDRKEQLKEIVKCMKKSLQ